MTYSFGTAGKLAVLSFVMLWVNACHLSTHETILKELEKTNWTSKVTLAQDFYLFRATPKSRPTGDVINIVLEGDGKAWQTRFRPSSDPTPQTPVGFKIAKSLKGFSVYIARPCQYVEGDQRKNCHPVMWTNARFAPEVVTSMNVAINQVKQEYAINRIRLFGFSGGGTLAALIAANRDDVVELITMAAPLDTDEWTSFHDLSPLRNSLNPVHQIDVWGRLPQWHFAGEADDVVPASLYEHVLGKVMRQPSPSLTVLPGFDHTCCWETYFTNKTRW